MCKNVRNLFNQSFKPYWDDVCQTTDSFQIIHCHRKKVICKSTTVKSQFIDTFLSFPGFLLITLSPDDFQNSNRGGKMGCNKTPLYILRLIKIN